MEAGVKAPSSGIGSCMHAPPPYMWEEGLNGAGWA